ncbi:hypothetical protein [Streptomyces halobius]|uniref:Uncharacterized protein n=1 Tax=Streptomyces halobius TaxID=2879846 RepID=A0ABY4M002_9ACTN|nr:hypothetical protein [Streptomyces halobius]UQA91074.1 hypothetical protein K9S39_03525 [Streptomyces halobius]
MDMPCGNAARSRIRGAVLAMLLLGCVFGAWAGGGSTMAEPMGHAAQSGPTAGTLEDGTGDAGHPCARQDERCPEGRVESNAYADAAASDHPTAADQPVQAAARLAPAPRFHAPPCPAGPFSLCVIRT